MPERGFFVALDPEALNWMRARIITVRGRVVGFTIQYETMIDGLFVPVTRYDSAHGTPHQDSLNRRGQLTEKRWLFDLSNEYVVTMAIDDIRSNWKLYKERFDRGARS